MPRMGKKRTAARKKAGASLSNAGHNAGAARGFYKTRGSAWARHDEQYRERHARAYDAYRKAGGTKGKKIKAKRTRRQVGRIARTSAYDAPNPAKSFRSFTSTWGI